MTSHLPLPTTPLRQSTVRIQTSTTVSSLWPLKLLKPPIPGARPCFQALFAINSSLHNYLESEMTSHLPLPAIYLRQSTVRIQI